MGQVQTASVETDIDGILPVPPHPDGRRTFCPFPRQPAKRNLHPDSPLTPLTPSLPKALCPPHQG